MMLSPVFDIYASTSLYTGDLASGKYIYSVIIHDKLKNVSAECKYNFKVIKQP